MKNIILTTSIGLTLIAGVSANTNAALASNTTLNIGAQTGYCADNLGSYPDDCTIKAIPTGNYIEIFNHPNPNAQDTDRIALNSGTDGGITLGSTQTTGEIDTWTAFGASGWHSQAGTISIASDDGAGNVTLNMSGLELIWNNQLNVLTQGTDATITCGFDCSNNDTYTLDYSSVMTSVGISGYLGYRPFT